MAAPLITAALLQTATGCTAERAATFAPALAETCARFGIITSERIAMFLAQIGHESGSLRFVAEIWGPTAAQQRYEGRKDLGNTQPGDGERFRGRGLIQTTGRFNYGATAEGLRAYRADVPDFVAEPQALERLPWSALSAGWYWSSRGLNRLADAGDFEAITRRINGGLNGQDDRLARLVRARQAVLAAAPASVPTPATPAALPPVEDRSIYVTLESETMSPFIAAALPAILEAVPKLGGLFGSGSQVSERNIKVAETVVQVAKTAIAATNEQDLVERLKDDPAAAATVRQAIEHNWFELQQQAEASRGAAREFVQAYSAHADVRTVLGNLTFPELLTLLFVTVSAAGAGIVLLQGDYSAEIKGSVITLMLIAGYTGVREFWFGSSPAEQAAARKQGLGPSAD